MVLVQAEAAFHRRLHSGRESAQGEAEFGRHSRLNFEWVKNRQIGSIKSNCVVDGVRQRFFGFGKSLYPLIAEIRITKLVRGTRISGSPVCPSYFRNRHEMVTDRKTSYKAPPTIITDNLISQEARRSKVSIRPHFQV
jgi:hypothetical protein